MNMETLLSTVMNNLNSVLKTENTISGNLSLAEWMPQGLELKAGQAVVLNIDSNGQMLLTASNGKQETLPSEVLTMERAGQVNAPAIIEAKIGQVQNNTVKLQIQSINNQPPQQYFRAITQTSTSQIPAETIIKDISGGQSIPLPRVNLAEAAKPFIAKIPLDPQQKIQLQNALQQIEIKVQVNNLQPSESVALSSIAAEETIQAPLQKVVAETAVQISSQQGGKTPLEKISVQQNIVSTAAEKLQNMIGQTFHAEVVPTEGNTIFRTPLGNILPDTPVQIPESMVAELEVTAVFVQPENGQSLKMQTASDKFEQTLQHLKSENPQLYQKIAAHLPTDNDKMLGNMNAFVKAAAKGDVRQWLGSEIVHQLETQGTSGREILSDFQNILQSSNRQTPAWRIIEIPYYAENHIETIRLAIKQYPDDEEETEDPRQKFGTRFVVDTNFTRLGAFQFDGFSIAKDHRFDLIIRTERSIGNDLCANIMQLFKTTLNEVGYVGNIKINLKENFIKISENNTEDKFLSQDLFI